MKNKKQNDKLNSQDPLSKSLIYISGRGINIDKCILKDHSRPTGLNSTSQDRFLQSFISPWVSFNGKKKKSEKMSGQAGIRRMGTLENPGGRTGSLCEGRASKGGWSMQESPRDLHPSPHLRKKRKRKVPTTPHPPTSPRTHSSTSVYPLLPTTPGSKRSCEEGGGW